MVRKTVHLLFIGLMSVTLLSSLAACDDGGDKKATTPPTTDGGADSGGDDEACHVDCPKPSGDSDYWIGAWYITSPGAYKDFLGSWPNVYGQVTCDPYSHWNWGSISCDNYTGRAAIDIELWGAEPPYQGVVTFIAEHDGSWTIGGGGYSEIVIYGNFVESDGDLVLWQGGPGPWSKAYNDEIRIVLKGGLAEYLNVELFYREFDTGSAQWVKMGGAPQLPLQSH